jgi:hypothetical protein
MSFADVFHSIILPALQSVLLLVVLLVFIAFALCRASPT